MPRNTRKRQLEAQVTQLQAQLAAQGGQTRKALNAYVQATRAENERLRLEVAMLRAKLPAASGGEVANG